MTPLKVGLRLPVFDGRAIRGGDLVNYHDELGMGVVQFDDGTQLPVYFGDTTTVEGTVEHLISILKNWRDYMSRVTP